MATTAARYIAARYIAARVVSHYITGIHDSFTTSPKKQWLLDLLSYEELLIDGQQLPVQSGSKKPQWVSCFRQ